MLFMFLVLFLTCFVSSTLWPMASEVVFVAYLHQNNDAVLSLLAVATIGNALGSILMFELGYCTRFWLKRRNAERSKRVDQWTAHLTRLGSPVLLLSWLPIIGDVLPVAAGLLKMSRFWSYVWLVLGKAGRYSVLAFMVLAFTE